LVVSERNRSDEESDDDYSIESAEPEDAVQCPSDEEDEEPAGEHANPNSTTLEDGEEKEEDEDEEVDSDMESVVEQSVLARDITSRKKRSRPLTVIAGFTLPLVLLYM